MTASSPITAIVLAAGQGTRMKSTRAKVLHELAGAPMVHHVVWAALEAGADDVIVVVGFDGDSVAKSLERTFGGRVHIAHQDRQLGTGHAVQCALPELSSAAEIALVLCGDTPLLWADDLSRLRDSIHDGAELGMLTYVAADPTGYGRVLRDAGGRIRAVREHRDCTEEERAVCEVNPAVYITRIPFLRGALAGLTTDNAQGELYFTDVVAVAAADGSALGVNVTDPGSLVGVNDRAQLAAAEAVLYERIADRWRREGATVRAGARIDAGVVVEPEATIESGVVLRGKTRVGHGATIDVGSVLTDCTVGPGALVKPYSVGTDSSIGERAQIGPFSHLRPASEIHDDAHIGNFVETKKTVVRRGAKANHLAYLGDGDVGEGANVGAGTIFCNYDGFAKHQTVIGPGAFIGSDSQLVAPVTIGEGAYVGTGTTVTKDVPADGLAIGRARQENKEGYGKRLRSRLAAAAAAAKKKA
jgi:bifunctional UDP-N-acetylglucosamine pyrophosphorylase / glucosamine-1-phosphate N-acetyltransferase